MQEEIVKLGRLVVSWSHGGGRITEVLTMGGFTVKYSQTEITYSGLDNARIDGLQFYNDAEDNYIQPIK